MGDIMRPIPFEELLTRIFDEYQQQRSIGDAANLLI